MAESVHSMAKDTIEGFALSPPQAHLWSLRDEEPGDPWRVRCAVRVTGRIEVGALLEALTATSARHEILRTKLDVLSNGTPAQIVETNPALSVEVAELDGIDADAIEEFLAVEITGGAIVRAVLAKAGDQEHVLVLDLPAFMADATATWLIVKEVAARLAGEDPAAATDDDESVQYADTAQWMLDTLDDEDEDEGRAHWAALDLAGVDDVRLALEGPASTTAFRPHDYRFALPPATQDALSAAAAELGVAPAALLLTAWQVLLARHADLQRPVVGVAAAGRGYEGLDRAFGLFQRTLPLAVDVDPATSFAALTRETVRAMDAAEEHHELFALARIAPESSFLPHAFEYQPAPDRFERGGTGWELLARRTLTDRARLALVCDATARGTALRMRYDPGAFDGDVVARMAAQYLMLLARASTDVHAAVGTLSMLGDEERALVTTDFARVPLCAAPRLVTDLIGARAQETPNAVAVAADGRTLTYAELDAAANRLARHLRDSGAAANDFVGIHMTRSPEMIVAILGVLKAGAAYLPLPPAYPRERVAFMLEDTGAPLVLTRSVDRATLPDTGATVVVVDEDPALAAQDARPLADAPGADDLAYVIYTSGSTGKPKGVPITHGNLAHSTGARVDHYRHPITGYLLLSSFAFDSSVPGIFWTLCQGGRLVLPTEGFEQDITALGKLIAEHRTSHLLGLPSVYSLLLEHAGPGELASLTTAIVAGEACPRELVERHFATLPDVELHNEYGPTEGTVWSTVHKCAAGAPRTLVPIGRPVPGVDVYVLEASGAPAPIGLPGELHIGGAQVSPGYLGRPELNAEKFIADPFRAGGRLYKTGDLVRFLPDGTLEFLGRIDHQVKIRGYRIELEEIETVLVTHASVREAVVAAREDTPGDQRLVAYVTPSEGATIEPAALQEFLATPLPAYMVPNHVVTLDALPLLPNGKVDRHALPAPDADSAPTGGASAPPENALQRVMAGIWGEVLGAAAVGIDDDFFVLGGHSLLATRLFARLREMLQIDAPLRLLFDNSTIRTLTHELVADPAEGARLERTAEILLQVLGLTEE